MNSKGIRSLNPGVDVFQTNSGIYQTICLMTDGICLICRRNAFAKCVGSSNPRLKQIWLIVQLAYIKVD